MSVPGSWAGAEIEATVASLRQHLEAVRQHEVKRMRRHLGQMNSAQENAIESLTHSIVDQILETPIRVLRTVSRKNDLNSLIETVRRVFSLGESRDYSSNLPTTRSLDVSAETLLRLSE